MTHVLLKVTLIYLPSSNPAVKSRMQQCDDISSSYDQYQRNVLQMYLPSYHIRAGSDGGILLILGQLKKNMEPEPAPLKHGSTPKNEWAADSDSST